MMDVKCIKDFDEKVVKFFEFIGEFYSEELVIFYYFQVEEDKLIVKYSCLSDIILNLFKKDVFLGNVWYFG